MHLMRDSGIDDLGLEFEATIKLMENKFNLHLDDESAERAFWDLIEESLNAWMPAFMEMVHKAAVSMR